MKLKYQGGHQMTDRLQEFGHNFQIKSVVCLLTKPNFIEQIIDILDEIEMYKRNPKKAMKIFDCRQEKLGKRIYNKTKQLQQQVILK